VLCDQLKLPLPEERAGPRLPEHIRPMQAVEVDAPFDDPEYFFEPWWPGARALAFVESGRLRMQVSGLSDPMAAFPELGDLPQQVVGEGLVLDGTLLVLDDEGRPDPELLRGRLMSSPSIANGLGRPAYVASDLLWSEGVSWTRRPFGARRDRLTAVLPAGDRVIVGRGYVQEGTLVAEALAALGIEGLSARRLSARYRAGTSGDAWLRAAITPPEPRPRPTLALILRLPLA
jgi:bifunctional non-homologous end joining protein LigD